MKKITITVTNDLVTDQRMHRTAETLYNMGYSVTLIGRKLSLSEAVLRNYKTKRLNLLFRGGPMFYIEYNIRLFFLLLFTRTSLFLAVDLDTLFANFLVSKLKHVPLVYDAHELFTEMPELVHRPKVRKIWERLEKLLLNKLRHSYTVCNSIAKEYKLRYGANMSVVRNVPFKKEVVLTHVVYSLPLEKFVIYQGAVNLGRGLEMMLEAFCYIPQYKFVVAGSGDKLEDIKNLVEKLNLNSRVIFTGRLPLNDLHSITCRASLGVSVEENMGLNYYYALPNKLFDYIQARVPVLVSDLPEMKNIVESYMIGEVLKSRNPVILAGQIVSMIENPNYEKWKQNLEKAAQELNWENEQKIMTEVISEALKN